MKDFALGLALKQRWNATVNRLFRRRLLKQISGSDLFPYPKMLLDDNRLGTSADDGNRLGTNCYHHKHPNLNLTLNLSPNLNFSSNGFLGYGNKTLPNFQRCRNYNSKKTPNFPLKTRYLLPHTSKSLYICCCFFFCLFFMLKNFKTERKSHCAILISQTFQDEEPGVSSKLLLLFRRNTLPSAFRRGRGESDTLRSFFFLSASR